MRHIFSSKLLFSFLFVMFSSLHAMEYRGTTRHEIPVGTTDEEVVSIVINNAMNQFSLDDELFIVEPATAPVDGVIEVMIVGKNHTVHIKIDLSSRMTNQSNN